MKYPVSIRIRGHDYQIEYVEYDREVARDFESDCYQGTCSCNIIRILATKSQLIMVDTLIHETLHAIFTRNKMLKAALKNNMEESFIETLASEIALILLDNGLVKLPKRPPITTRIVPEARP